MITLLYILLVITILLISAIGGEAFLLVGLCLITGIYLGKTL
jgi:hypothetical protein